MDFIHARTFVCCPRLTSLCVCLSIVKRLNCFGDKALRFGIAHNPQLPHLPAPCTQQNAGAEIVPQGCQHLSYQQHNWRASQCQGSLNIHAGSWMGAESLCSCPPEELASALSTSVKLSLLWNSPCRTNPSNNALTQGPQTPNVEQ